MRKKSAIVLYQNNFFRFEFCEEKKKKTCDRFIYRGKISSRAKQQPTFSLFIFFRSFQNFFMKQFSFSGRENDLA